jgi:hypothetical protein
MSFSMMNEAEFITLKRSRQLESCSSHLTLVDVSAHQRQKKQISDWIWSNLQGRFWIGDLYRNRRWGFYVGFEQEYEASYFALKYLSAQNQS